MPGGRAGEVLGLHDQEVGKLHHGAQLGVQGQVEAGFHFHVLREEYVWRQDLRRGPTTVHASRRSAGYTASLARFLLT